jgi:hypothetical protein
MSERIMGSIAFAGDLDQDADGAEIALRRAGFHVTRMPQTFRSRLAHPDDELMEASKAGADDGAIMDEINAIVEQYGGLCDEMQSIASDYVPFAELFEKRPRRH